MFSSVLWKFTIIALALRYTASDGLLTLFPNVDENADYRKAIQNGIASARQDQSVQFYCVQPGSEEFIQVLSSSNTSMLAANFNLSLPWGFLIHGWTDSMFKDPKWMLNGRGWMQITVIDWAKYANINVCGVDWSPLAADQTYIVPALVNTHITAEYVVQFILNLVQAGVSTEHITIAGHSLGAHVAGFTGKKLFTQGHLLSKIWGLDPAGPLFTFPVVVTPENRLVSTDANFVQVIHTAANSLGTQICLGDADFWANGGEFQPICQNFNLEGMFLGGVIGPLYCSHFQAVEYFWYAINPINQFIGHYCMNGCNLGIFIDVLNGLCSATQTDIFGIYTDSKYGFYKLTTIENNKYATP